MYAHQHTHTQGELRLWLSFVFVFVFVCVVFVCVPPQPPSPCSVYFISYSLEFHFALFTKGRGAGGNGARKKKNMLRTKKWKPHRRQRFNYRKFLCTALLISLAHPAECCLSLPPSLPGICSRRSQLARENTRAHTHARSIFRCWQFRRLLWQHVTGMRNNERRQLAKSYFKLESVTLRTVQMRTNNLPSSQRYFYCDSASFSVNTHRTRLMPPSPFRALVLALQLTPQRAATLPRTVDHIEISFKIILHWNSICYLYMETAQKKCRRH